MRAEFNSLCKPEGGRQAVSEFLLSLPELIEEATRKCRAQGSRPNYIELSMPPFSFALSSPDGKPNYHLHPELKNIEEYCARPDVDMKMILSKWPGEKIRIYLDEPHTADGVSAGDSARQKYVAARTAHYNEALYADFDTVPQKIEDIREKLRENPASPSFIRFTLPLHNEFLPGYEAYQALHEYCKSSGVNAQIHGYRDTLYNCHFCVIDVKKPYATSDHAKQMKGFSGRKLPQPPSAPVSAVPKKDTLWRKIFGR